MQDSVALMVAGEPSDEITMLPFATRPHRGCCRRVYASLASVWEMAIKYKAGKFAAAASLVGRFASTMENDRFTELPASIKHAVAARLAGDQARGPF
jgi:PIN domain nuclease of toxin-antitoxin system